MKTIYIDKDFRCHTVQTAGTRAVDTTAFDGLCDVYIEGYRFIPEGESWTREDGVVFHGEMFSPATDFSELDAAQRSDERAAIETLGAKGESAPSVEASAIRTAMNTAGNTLTDETAFECAALFPIWDGGGKAVQTGWRCRYGGRFYRILQNHVTQPDWPPDSAASLYVEITDPAIEWPEWRQPTGAQDTYAAGDRVAHGGKRYVSQIDANDTEPGTDERWWKEHIA